MTIEHGELGQEPAEDDIPEKFFPSEYNEEEDYGEKFELPYYEHYYQDKGEDPYKYSPAIISEKDLDDVLLDRGGFHYEPGKNELFTEIPNFPREKDGGRGGLGSFLTKVDKQNNRVILFGNAIEGDASRHTGRDVIIFEKKDGKWHKIEKE